MRPVLHWDRGTKLPVIGYARTIHKGVRKNMSEPKISAEDENVKILLIEDDAEITNIVTQTLTIRWPQATLLYFFGYAGTGLAQK